MKLLQRFLALVCLILLFIFCISNREPMAVRFLNWQSPELPVFLLLVFAFLTGTVLALLWQSLRGVAGPKDKQMRKSKIKESQEPVPTDATPDLPAADTADADQPDPATDRKEGDQ